MQREERNIFSQLYLRKRRLFFFNSLPKKAAGNRKLKFSIELSPCYAEFCYCLYEVRLFENHTVCIKHTASESHPVLHKLLNGVGEPKELGNTATAVIACAAPSRRALLVRASLFYDLLHCSQRCFYPLKALIT